MVVFRSQKKASQKVQVLAVAALFSALSIVFGKVLTYSPADTILRFSFENLPILLAGIAFGGFVGALTGVVADLAGCLLVGYAINPLITLGAALIGFFGGGLFLLFQRLPLMWRLLFSVLLSHLLGSVLVKTFGLAVYYDMPFYVVLLWRLLNYTIVAVAEWLVLYVILKNTAIRRQLEKLS